MERNIVPPILLVSQELHIAPKIIIILLRSIIFSFFRQCNRCHSGIIDLGTNSSTHLDRYFALHQRKSLGILTRVSFSRLSVRIKCLSVHVRLLFTRSERPAPSADNAAQTYLRVWTMEFSPSFPPLSESSIRRVGERRAISRSCRCYFSWRVEEEEEVRA